MALSKPDPRFTQSKKAQRNFRLALKMALAFIGALWTIFMFDAAFGLGLVRFGLHPGSIAGLAGIFTAPLLHAGFGHILSNTLPMFISLTAMLYLYPKSAVRVIPAIWLGSGALTWLIGRPTIHIGASGLIYGLLAYVFVSGIIRKNLQSVSVSLLVGFLYGSMIWGVLPVRPYMSWEMHLTGASLGVLLAVVFRNWDRTPLLSYEWEKDDSVPEWYPESDPDKFELPDKH